MWSSTRRRWSGCRATSRGFWAVNVRGTRLALEAARDAGARRFVHLSSVVTFGLDFPDNVDERWPVQPTGVAYVDTKIAAEQVVLQAHAAGEAEVTVVRPGDVYGPASRPWTVMPVELMQGAAASRCRRAAAGSTARSTSTTSSTGIIAAAGADAAAGQVITLSGGVGVETREFFGHYARMLGPPRRADRADVGRARRRRGAGAESRACAARVNEVTPDGVRYLALAARHLRDRQGARAARLGARGRPRRGDEPDRGWLREQQLI